MSDNRTKEEIKAAMRKAADFFGQHVNHRTKRVDEISVTEHMLKMSQRIAELEAENARLREDAERYEYLRNPHNETYFLYQKDGFGGVELMSGPSLDDAIDEARKP